MITLNSYRVEQLKKRLPKIEDKFDRDVAAFMLTMLKPDSRPWMWKKHEIYKAGGESLGLVSANSTTWGWLTTGELITSMSSPASFTFWTLKPLL